MTYKAALAGLAHGGGKTVIIRPHRRFDRAALFRAFGRFVEDLRGHYITAEDSGTGLEDMEVIRSVTKHVTGVDPAHGGSGDPSPFTALGVRRGIEACVKFELGKRLARGHPRRGAGRRPRRLPPVPRARTPRAPSSPSPTSIRSRPSARSASSAPRSRRSTTSSTVECDVFAPCALGCALNDDTIPRLRCRIVAGAANNQLAEPRHGDGAACSAASSTRPTTRSTPAAWSTWRRRSSATTPRRRARARSRSTTRSSRSPSAARKAMTPTDNIANKMVEERLSNVR